MSSAMMAAALGLSMTGSGAPAEAAIAPQERAGPVQLYRIAPTPLAEALNALADQNGLRLSYDARLTRGVRTRGLSGTYALEDALRALLAGTALSFRMADNGRSVLITLAQNDAVRSDAGAEALPPIDVGAEAAGHGRPGRGGGDGKGYAIGHAATGTKTDTPLMETPVNVQTISPQVLKDRQITSLPDALKNVSGVTFQENAGGGWLGARDAGYVVMRGFQTGATYRDGFRNNYGSGGDSGFASLDFTNIDRIEVMKGSSAILYGMMEPGGLLNIVTKRPLDTPYASVQQQIGSFAFYRTSVDATGPIDAAKSLLYRVNFSYENAGSFIDHVRDDSFFISPVVTWRATQQTEVTLEAEWKKAHQGQYISTVPVYDTYNFIRTPRSRNYGEYSPIAIDQYLVGLTVAHEIDPDWKIRHHSQYLSANYDTRDVVGPYYVIDNGASADLYRYTESRLYRFGVFSTTTDLTGHFETGPLKHTLILGGDFYRQSTNGTYIYPVNASSVIDLLAPVHPGVSRTSQDFVQSRFYAAKYDYGVYAQDQIELPYGFHVLGGARFQATRFLLNNITDPPYGSGLIEPYPTLNATRVTPRVGLLWRAREWLSLYGNYAEGYGFNTALTFDNRVVPPSDARQFEFGAKAEFFDGRVQATAAYYDLVKTNVPTADPAHFGFNLVTGEVRTKGPELDIQGEILPGWNVIATYANTEALVIKDNDASKVGTRFWAVPRNTASFWTSYEVQDGDLRGFKFGGGVTYRDASRLYNYLGTKNAPDLSPYATIDIMGSYSFDLVGTKVTAQLNVTNLFDHAYYTTGITPYYAAPGWNIAARAYGAPRGFKGSIKVEF